MITGCNVENASYGLTLCAECGLVSELHRSGGGRLVAVTCVAGPVDGARLVTDDGATGLIVTDDGSVLELEGVSQFRV